MSKKRGRPGIKPQVKQLIFDRATKNKGTPRLALAVELKKLIEEMGELPPTEETMIRLISQARNREPNPLDSPWSLISVEKYPNLFPAESLPYILRAWVHVRENLEITFTIRQAKWVARLYTVIKDIGDLVKEALGYSQIELIADINPGGEIESAGSDLHLYELMTGETVSLDRRSRILNIDIELFESILKPIIEKDFSIQPLGSKPAMKNELPQGTSTHWGNRDFMEKYLDAYRLIMKDVKSEEEWLKRLPKLKQLFKELGIETPEQHREESNYERSHKEEG